MPARLPYWSFPALHPLFSSLWYPAAESQSHAGSAFRIHPG